ncbi:MAG: hypothetical protein J3K34DRAFT_427065 [Monoraphidium minutum]|nr:MAG: hypothetical protein J3K34DRAFT_427065 [Monoraphidium minutum]
MHAAGDTLQNTLRGHGASLQRQSRGLLANDEHIDNPRVITMSPPRGLLAVLAVALLAALPAASAQLTCTNATLPAGSNCNTVFTTQDTFVTFTPNTTTNGTNTTAPPLVVTFNGPQPMNVSGDNYTFTAGLVYPYTATAGNETCNGTVSVTPCTPACLSPLSISVDAAVNASCEASLTAAAFFDPATIGAAATGVTMTSANGSQAAPPVLYTPGDSYAITGVVSYPTGDVSTGVCYLTVVDNTTYAAPVALPPPSGLTEMCFWANKTRGLSSYSVSVNLFAAFAPNKSMCATGNRLGVTLCDPAKRGRNRRVCMGTTQGTQHGFNVLRKNMRAKQEVTATVQVWDGNAPPSNAATATVKAIVYKNKPPKSIRSQCIVVSENL